MAIERKWLAVPARPFTANGTADGIVTIEDTSGFYTKSKVTIKSDAMQEALFQVLRVLSPTQILIGSITAKIGSNQGSNLSAYLASDNATIAATEQDKNNIPDKDHYVAVYESDPIVADRVINVDKHGNFYDTKNPLPVQLSDGAINVETLNAQVAVHIDHRDNYPNAGDVHDSTRIGDGTNEMGVNPSGSINVENKSSAADKEWDELILARDPDTQDIIGATYKKNSSVVRTLTMSYDANENLEKVTKS